MLRVFPLIMASYALRCLSCPARSRSSLECSNEALFMASFIGGTSIKDIPLSQLADIVSFVTQDNFLFNCSIKENICLPGGDPENEHADQILVLDK